MTETMHDDKVVSLNPAVAQPTKQTDQSHPAEPQAPDTGEPSASTSGQPPQSQTGSLEQSASKESVKVADIVPGNLDCAKREITQVYTVVPGQYAIYKAGAVKARDVNADDVNADDVNAGDVMVQFADDPGTAREQRKKLLQIGAARAEINVLLEGLGCRDIGDRQLASALQLALDDSLEDAKATVAAEKARILAKRAARGRFQYLKWSYGAAALLMVLLFIASWLDPIHSPSSDVWLAAKAGLVGAAFSISQAIHGRNVAFGTDKLDNITDGVLRLVIGIISAGVLLLLFASEIIPSMKLGNADLTGAALTWQKVLVIGFVGGFLERVIPDLLKKQDPQQASIPTGPAAKAGSNA